MNLRIQIAKFLVLFTVVISLGCGVKGPPIPYVSIEGEDFNETRKVQKGVGSEALQNKEASSKLDSMRTLEKGKK